MRNAIVTLLLALVSGSAMADWVKVASVDEFDSYIDPPSIQKHGDLRRGRVLDDLKVRGSNGELSVTAFWEWDCKEKRARHIAYKEYSEPMGRGKVLRSDRNNNAPWEGTVPDTVGDGQLKFVCSR